MSAFAPRTLVELQLAAWPPELVERGHTSPAQLKMAARCLEQFRRRYIKEEKMRPGAALVWGGADHEAIQNNMAQKVLTGKDLTVAEIQDLFASLLDERIEKDGGPAELEWEKGARLTGGDASAAAGDMKDRGVALVGHYHTEVSPRVKPTIVEASFEVPAERYGLPVPIIGYVDVVAEVPTSPGAETTKERLLERKVTGRNAVSPEWALQGKMYGLAFPGLELEFQLSLKNKTPKVSAFEHIFEPEPEAITAARVQRIMARISSAYALYGPDEPWDAATGGFSDVCGFCGFKPSCPWWHEEAWRPAA